MCRKSFLHDGSVLERHLYETLGAADLQGDLRLFADGEEFMTLILVMDNDFAIGKNGGLLCSLPEDMKHFRGTTKDSIVVMGRKTYESFPKRPLPNRENLVLSHSVKELDGARVFGDISALLEYVKGADRQVFVIGGGEIYKQLEPYCNEALITRVYENFGGDVFFKDIEHDRSWRFEESSPVIETGGKRIRFMRFVRTENDD